MKLRTVTGGARDYLELIPQSAEETAGIVFCGTSEFVDSNAVFLDLTPEKSPYLALRVYLGPARPA